MTEEKRSGSEADSPGLTFDIDIPRKIHIVGIGGAGMSAIATLLVSLGHEVTGSDFRDSRFTRQVKAVGAHVSIGHRAANVSGADAIAISSAVRESNSEVRAARQDGIPVLRRSDILALLTRRWQTIAVAGTHGKTTLSSMLVSVLDGAGLDPSYVIGAALNDSGANGHRGTGPHLVCESDESDGTFLELDSFAAIVTNVEADHLEHYGDLDSLEAAFRRFLSHVDGPRVVCGDDPGVARAVEGLDTVTYGFGQHCKYRAADVSLAKFGATYTLVVDDIDAGGMRIALPGRHNVLNSLGAAAMALEVGADVSGLRRGFANYRGVARRFEYRGQADGVALVDDYAHLPTEVSAAIDAARSGNWERVVAVFQPHLYSRTSTYAAGFGRALSGADVVVVTDVFAAREDPVPGVTGELVVREVERAGAQATYVPHRSELAAAVAKIIRPGDVCVSLGAGDITSLADELHVRLGDKTPGDPISLAADEIGAVLRAPPQRDMPLSQMTTYRVGGSASLFAEPENEQELLDVAAVIRRHRLPILVVGRGSNMLVSDSGFDGVALHLGPGFNWVSVDTAAARITAGASTPLPHLARIAGSESLAGFEFGVGIPASVGGAVRMNAGGHGSEMAGVLASVGVVDLRSDAGEVDVRSADDLDLGYRHSNLGPDEVVVWAEFVLSPGDSSAIAERLGEIVRWRKDNQPGGLGNAGSVFTNPVGDSAGRLIDTAGCKGLAVGGAAVSELHANFITAESWATASDVFGVMNAVERRVLDVHGVSLAPEVRLVGEFLS